MWHRRTVLRLLAGTVLFEALGGRGAALARPQRIRPDSASMLIVVDVQNCFIGGSLAVPRGSEVVPVINRIAPAFQNVILTQDWHPPGHISFASSHAGRKAYESITLTYGKQVLWPEHCVAGTADAALHPGLRLPQGVLIVRKGFHRDMDSYSAFMEADRKTPTGLRGYLKERGFRRVFVTGLATDFCVAWTALDARRAGFETFVVEDACRGIDLNGSLAAAWADMKRNGVQRIQSSDIQLP